VFEVSDFLVSRNIVIQKQRHQYCRSVTGTLLMVFKLCGDDRSRDSRLCIWLNPGDRINIRILVATAWSLSILLSCFLDHPLHLFLLIKKHIDVFLIKKHAPLFKLSDNLLFFYTSLLLQDTLSCSLYFTELVNWLWSRWNRVFGLWEQTTQWVYCRVVELNTFLHIRWLRVVKGLHWFCCG